MRLCQKCCALTLESKTSKLPRGKPDLDPSIEAPDETNDMSKTNNNGQIKVESQFYLTTNVSLRDESPGNPKDRQEPDS